MIKYRKRRAERMKFLSGVIEPGRMPGKQTALQHTSMREQGPRTCFWGSLNLWGLRLEVDQFAISSIRDPQAAGAA